MIRQANKYDINNIIEMLKNYRDADTLQTVKNASDRDYIVSLLSHIIAGMGIILIAEKEKPLGLLIAIINPSIWNPYANELHELAYWVEPEARGGTLGYRLLKAYCDYGNQLKNEGRIDYYTISKMVESPDIKYQKFGFKKIEETWIA